MILLVVGSIVFSLFAVFIVYVCATNRMKKINVIYAIMLELIVVATVASRNPSVFGLSGIPALLMMMANRKQH